MRGRGQGRGRGRSKSTIARHLSSLWTNVTWSMKEKKRLLDGLRRYSYDDLDSLSRMVPTRTKSEIQEYIKVLKGPLNFKQKTDNRMPVTRAPIESWMDLAKELVYYEKQDLSKLLGNVFSILGHFSDFPEPKAPHLEPDYRKLYSYIAAVMDDDPELPELTSLESAVIVDLMHGIGEVLRVSDMSVQRKVMCWKYKMLNHKYNFDDLRSNLERLRKAFMNDFSDLFCEKDSPVSEQQESSSTTTVSLATTDLSKNPPFSTDISQSDESDDASDDALPDKAGSSAVIHSSLHQTKSHSGNDAQSVKSSDNFREETIATIHTKSAAIVVTSQEVPPGNCTDNIQPVSKVLQPLTAKFSGSVPIHTVITTATLGETETHQSGHLLHKQENCGETRSSNVQNDSHDTFPVRSKGRKRIHAWREPLEKPRLYTMNPFCVPVNLLRLKQLVSVNFPSLILHRSQQNVSREIPASTEAAGQKTILAIRSVLALKNASTSQPDGVLRQLGNETSTTGTMAPTALHGRREKTAEGTRASISESVRTPGGKITARESAGSSTQREKSDADVIVDDDTVPDTNVAVNTNNPTTNVEASTTNQNTFCTTSNQKLVPGQAYSVVYLTKGQLALVPVSQPKTSERSTLLSPLRAPVTGCAVSVGTSDSKLATSKLKSKAAAAVSKAKVGAATSSIHAPSSTSPTKSSNKSPNKLNARTKVKIAGPHGKASPFIMSKPKKRRASPLDNFEINDAKVVIVTPDTFERPHASTRRPHTSSLNSRSKPTGTKYFKGQNGELVPYLLC